MAGRASLAFRPRSGHTATVSIARPNALGGLVCQKVQAIIRRYEQRPV